MHSVVKYIVVNLCMIEQKYLNLIYLLSFVKSLYKTLIDDIELFNFNCMKIIKIFKFLKTRISYKLVNLFLLKLR